MSRLGVQPFDLDQYKTLDQIVQSNPAVFKRSRLLGWVREAAHNGLAPHVLRQGRTIAIHLPGLLGWMKIQAKRKRSVKPSAAEQVATTDKSVKTAARTEAPKKSRARFFQ